ncbi:DUF2971 domain-containing protein [Cupriavidus sp. RAF20_2]|uniref:DUF2971 domain-containing protein n=1 Tax=Cupriavidus sp. RAF20_2 TaxID=3233053 RepID=UPI003F9121E1
MPKDHKKYHYFKDPKLVTAAMSNSEVRKLLRTPEGSGYPTALYKYRTPIESKLRPFLIDSELFLSSRDQFNDPFDARANVVISKDGAARTAWAKALAKRNGLDQKKRAHLIQIAQDPLRAQEHVERQFAENLGEAGIFSFAGDPRDILMWSHYAQNHEGVCLRFEIAVDRDNLLAALPVEYTETYPLVEYMVEGSAQATLMALLRKAPHWRYEKERRIVVAGKAHHFVPYRASALTHVVYGCNAKEESIELVGRLLEERKAKGLPLPNEWFAHRSKDRYSLGLFRTRSAPVGWSGRATWPPPR